MTDIQQMSVAELHALRVGENPPIILDVRTPGELAVASIDGVIHIPMNDITSRFDELDETQNIVVMCHHGYRSMQVAMYLTQKGFENVSNLAGGIDAWSCHIDSKIPRY